MKLSKIVLSSAATLALALAVGNAPQANASTPENTSVNTATPENTSVNTATPEVTDVNESTINEDIGIVPAINWTGNSYLTRNVWSNVVGSNNVFRDTPTVYNWAGNPGEAVFRIVDGNGDIVATSGYVKPGSSTKLGPIPAFSGTYTLQASVEKTGTYTIKID